MKQFLDSMVGQIGHHFPSQLARNFEDPFKRRLGYWAVCSVFVFAIMSIFIVGRITPMIVTPIAVIIMCIIFGLSTLLTDRKDTLLSHHRGLGAFEVVWFREPLMGGRETYEITNSKILPHMLVAPKTIKYQNKMVYDGFVIQPLKKEGLVLGIFLRSLPGIGGNMIIDVVDLTKMTARIGEIGAHGGWIEMKEGEEVRIKIVSSSTGFIGNIAEAMAREGRMK
jgi:hypothetical protein